jgi:hypothetical protein
VVGNIETRTDFVEGVEAKENEIEKIEFLNLFLIVKLTAVILLCFYSSEGFLIFQRKY